MTQRRKPSKQELDEVFGTALPDTTRDERDLDASAEGPAHERWLRDNVPPHHD
ncbi:hypothetical protein ACAG25_18485 [Mycobacterium sp. pV006]|uniref:hypothetical protein n=1 Tax=Mycobacterium sp. pV006 TaxID=3238983 RepID=UPI00351BBBD5